MMIVLLGPDGSGKSSLIEELCDVLKDDFQSIETHHLRLSERTQKTSKRADSPHEKPPYSCWLSIVKLLYFLWIYQSGYWQNRAKIKSQNRLIIMDRYYHDLLADPLRYRYGGPLWFARVIGRWIPAPHCFIILHAPAEVLQQRKQEVSAQESHRQQQAYLDLGLELNNALILDTTQSLEHSVRLTLDYLRERLP